MTNKKEDLGNREPTGTRQAVESSIEISKMDKHSTWEQLALHKISHWGTPNATPQDDPSRAETPRRG